MSPRLVRGEAGWLRQRAAQPCLADVNASSDPATEDPNREVDRPVRSSPVWTTCLGAVTGLTATVGAVAVKNLGRRGSVIRGRRTMTTRRIVGIDLGLTSAHTVVVIDEAGEALARRRCHPTLESLERIEAAALQGAPEGTSLEVIVEPTGAAWLPVAVFFSRRGYVVYRVSSAKAAALRRFLSQHAKSNSIDALALARLGIVDRDGLQRLELPEGSAASLDRRVRAADRLTETATRQKTRLRELARQAMPTSTTPSPASCRRPTSPCWSATATQERCWPPPGAACWP